MTSNPANPPQHFYTKSSGSTPERHIWMEGKFKWKYATCLFFRGNKCIQINVVNLCIFTQRLSAAPAVHTECIFPKQPSLQFCLNRCKLSPSRKRNAHRNWVYNLHWKTGTMWWSEFCKKKKKIELVSAWCTKKGKKKKKDQQSFDVSQHSRMPAMDSSRQSLFGSCHRCCVWKKFGRSRRVPYFQPSR